MHDVSARPDPIGTDKAPQRGGSRSIGTSPRQASSP